MNYNFVKFIEKNGCVDQHGHRLYGTAALLYILSCPIDKIPTKYIKRGKAFIEKCIVS